MPFTTPNKELRFGNLKNTNDPKEFFPYHINMTLPTIKLFDYFELNRQINEEIHKYKLLCFTLDDATNEIRGYTRPRMWAQYSNNHNGICLAINKIGFERELKIILKKYNVEYIYQGKIEYELKKINDKHDFKMDKYINYENKKGSINIKKFVRDNIDIFHFTKSPDWINENEYRYLIYTDSKEVFVSLENILSGVIYGNSFNELIFEKMIEFYESDNILSTKLFWHNGIARNQGVCSSYNDYLFKKYLLKVRDYLLNFGYQSINNHEQILETLETIEKIQINNKTNVQKIKKIKLVIQKYLKQPVINEQLKHEIINF